jgi:ferredoxin
MMQTEEAPVIVICGDVDGPSSPHRLEELEQALRAELPGSLVLVVPGICEGSKALADALSELGPRRVAVGCRAATQRRGELLAGLRRAGVAATGADIVDLQLADAVVGQVVVEQSVALLGAAVVRVAHVGLDAPGQERTSLSVPGVSRRSLFRAFDLARRPVAVWRRERCSGGLACSACLSCCPRGALLEKQGRVVVDGDRCTGCGACVLACRNGAFALPGAFVEDLSAAAGVLVRSIKSGVPAIGIAITCQHSTSGPRVGEQWLVLRVPSLEMVTAGWMLQLVNAGVAVRLAACDAKECGDRAADLERFVRDLGAVLGLSSGASAFSEVSAVRDRVAGAAAAVGPNGDVRIELREPEATMQILSALAAFDPGRSTWRAQGRGCPFGSVKIDSVACSLCEVCVATCPTGALSSERDESGLVSLNLDPGRCTACGACLDTCPEGAVTLERAIEGADVAAGRRVVAVATEPEAMCEFCGAPLVGRLSPAALVRAGGSHRFLTAGARAMCADCRLGGRSVTSSGYPRR